MCIKLRNVQFSKHRLLNVQYSQEINERLNEHDFKFR